MGGLTAPIVCERPPVRLLVLLNAMIPRPDVPTRVLQGRDDRFLPAEFQRAIAEQRLGITPDEMAGGHLLALSRPRELARRLEAYRG